MTLYSSAQVSTIHTHTHYSYTRYDVEKMKEQQFECHKMFSIPNSTKKRRDCALLCAHVWMFLMENVCRVGIFHSSIGL